MKYSPSTDLNRDVTHYPPRIFLQAISGRGESWTANPNEVVRAEWMWSKRPATRLYDWIRGHSFSSFALFTIATVPLIPWCHPLTWLCAFLLYPLCTLHSMRQMARWEDCYRRSLWRIVLR